MRERTESRRPLGCRLCLLSQVNLHVSPPLITPGELPAALLATEWLLASVCANVCGQVVAAAECAHADATLERFVAGVYAEVPTQLV